MTSSCSSDPTNRTRSATRSSRASCSRVSASGPSPMIVELDAGCKRERSDEEIDALPRHEPADEDHAEAGIEPIGGRCASWWKRTPFGMTSTSSRCDHSATTPARWSLGVITRVAFRVVQLRSQRIARTDMVRGASCWKSSKPADVRDRRVARSQAGSPTILSTTGRPASLAPATAGAPRPVA